MPPDLVVTNLHIKHEEDLWRVQMTGTLQTTVKQPTPAVLSNSVSLLMSRLVNGPFHMRVWDGNEGPKEKDAASKAGSGGNFSSWVAKLATAAPAAVAKTENQFVIEGVMR